MSKVEFTYSKGGKKVKMPSRTAEALRKMGYGFYETRMLTAAPALVVEEPRASVAIQEFAKENGVDIEKIVGTGKDGRIKKSDVEAVIDARDLI
jgi:pyruvate/2-oxoglutarate dehydrogenase complex dihydrolipoamide acyltransferase (E2) component